MVAFKRHVLGFLNHRGAILVKNHKRRAFGGQNERLESHDTPPEGNTIFLSKALPVDATSKQRSRNIKILPQPRSPAAYKAALICIATMPLNADDPPSR